MNKLEVKTVLIKDIKPHPKNARKHDEENIQAIMRSLETFGQRSPIVVNGSNLILKGNGTHEAALRLDWKTIQAIKVTHLSPEEELAYALADNKTSDMSEFDFQGVSEIMEELRDRGFDLESTGFRDFELEPLLDNVIQQEDNLFSEDTLTLKFSGDSVKTIRDAIQHARIKYGETKDLQKDESVIIYILEKFYKKQLKRKSNEKNLRRRAI